MRVICLLCLTAIVYSADIQKVLDDRQATITAADQKAVRALLTIAKNSKSDRLEAYKEILKIDPTNEEATKATGDTPDIVGDPTATKVKLPNGVTWHAFDSQAGIKKLYKLGGYPVGTETKDVMNFILSGDVKKAFMGSSFAMGSADNKGEFHCDKESHMETYWILYLKPTLPLQDVLVRSDTQVDWSRNSLLMYLDGEVIQSGKVTLTNQGHVLVMKQTHNANGNDEAADTLVWVKLLSEKPLLIAP